MLKNTEQENVRLRYCDGKDKYFHPTGIKDVEKIYLVKRNVANETFVTNFPFI